MAAIAETMLSGARINPQNIHDHFKFRVEDGQLQAVWRIEGISATKLVRAASEGALIGGAGGALVSTIVCAITRGKINPRIIGLSAAGGAVAGATIGGGYSAVKEVRRMRSQRIELNRDRVIQDRLDEVTPEQISALVKTLFDTIFDEDHEQHAILCPISAEVMVTPVITPCGHVFDFPNITNWLENHDSCPMCRTEVDEDTLNFCSDAFTNINIAVRRVLGYLSEIHMDDEVLEAAEDPDSALELNADTVERIKARTLTTLEAAAISTYLRGAAERYNGVVTDVYENVSSQLQSLRSGNRLTSIQHAREVQRLTEWYTSYFLDLEAKEITTF